MAPKKRCVECGTSKTPQFRSGPDGRGTLCNSCGMRYKAGTLYRACWQAGVHEQPAGTMGVTAGTTSMPGGHPVKSAGQLRIVREAKIRSTLIKGPKGSLSKNSAGKGKLGKQTGDEALRQSHVTEALRRKAKQPKLARISSSVEDAQQGQVPDAVHEELSADEKGQQNAEGQGGPSCKGAKPPAEDHEDVRLARIPSGDGAPRRGRGVQLPAKLRDFDLNSVRKKKKRGLIKGPNAPLQSPRKPSKPIKLPSRVTEDYLLSSVDSNLVIRRETGQPKCLPLSTIFKRASLLHMCSQAHKKRDPFPQGCLLALHVASGQACANTGHAQSHQVAAKLRKDICPSGAEVPKKLGERRESPQTASSVAAANGAVVLPPMPLSSQANGHDATTACEVIGAHWDERQRMRGLDGEQGVGEGSRKAPKGPSRIKLAEVLEEMLAHGLPIAPGSGLGRVEGGPHCTAVPEGAVRLQENGGRADLDLNGSEGRQGGHASEAGHRVGGEQHRTLTTPAIPLAGDTNTVSRQNSQGNEGLEGGGWRRLGRGGGGLEGHSNGGDSASGGIFGGEDSVGGHEMEESEDGDDGQESEDEEEVILEATSGQHMSLWQSVGHASFVHLPKSSLDDAAEKALADARHYLQSFPQYLFGLRGR